MNPVGIISTFAGNGRYAREWTFVNCPDPKLPQLELGDNGPASLASSKYLMMNFFRNKSVTHIILIY